MQNGPISGAYAPVFALFGLFSRLRAHFRGGAVRRCAGLSARRPSNSPAAPCRALSGPFWPARLCPAPLHLPPGAHHTPGPRRHRRRQPAGVSRSEAQQLAPAPPWHQVGRHQVGRLSTPPLRPGNSPKQPMTPRPPRRRPLAQAAGPPQQPPGDAGTEGTAGPWPRQPAQAAGPRFLASRPPPGVPPHTTSTEARRQPSGGSRSEAQQRG